MIRTKTKRKDVSRSSRMSRTRVVSGFRTTIPKEIRKTYAVKEGMQVVWYDVNGEIRIFFRKPVKSIKELEGCIRGGRDLSKVDMEDLLDRVHGL